MFCECANQELFALTGLKIVIILIYDGGPKLKAVNVVKRVDSVTMILSLLLTL